MANQFFNGKKDRVTIETSDGVVEYYRKVPGTYSPILGTSEYELMSSQKRFDNFEINDSTVKKSEQIEEMRQAEEETGQEIPFERKFFEGDVQVMKGEDISSIDPSKPYLDEDGYIHDGQHVWKVKKSPGFWGNEFQVEYDSFHYIGENPLAEESSEPEERPTQKPWWKIF